MNHGIDRPAERRTDRVAVGDFQWHHRNPVSSDGTEPALQRLPSGTTAGGDIMALLHQLLHEIASDEAVGTGDEGPHEAAV